MSQQPNQRQRPMKGRSETHVVGLIATLHGFLPRRRGSDLPFVGLRCDESISFCGFSVSMFLGGWVFQRWWQSIHVALLDPVWRPERWNQQLCPPSHNPVNDGDGLMREYLTKFDERILWWWWWWWCCRVDDGDGLMRKCCDERGAEMRKEKEVESKTSTVEREKKSITLFNLKN